MYSDPNLAQVARVDPELALVISNRGGFIVTDEMPKLIEISRMMLVMVRCSGGRFICPVQDATHFMDIIERDADANNGQPSEYVRDVSLTHNVVVKAA